MFETKQELKNRISSRELEIKVWMDRADLLEQQIEKLEQLNATLRKNLHNPPCKEGPWCEGCSFARIAVDTNADKTVRYCKHDACKNFDQKQ